MKGKCLFTIVVLLLAAVPSVAQTVTADEIECVPLQPHDDNKNHSVVTANVSPDPANVEVRLYFRRMHVEVEDFYYSIMQPAGNGNYWGVLPDPEDHEVKPKELDDGDDTNTEWADWWIAKDESQDRDPNGDLDTDTIRERAQVGMSERRDWIHDMSREDLTAWLTDQKSEPTEYFVAVYDAGGQRLSRSEMMGVSVREDCRVELDTKQIGEASNQTIGETAAWQHDQAVFHWECDHLVTRIDYAGVKAADAVCRACVVAVIPFWIPASVAGAALAGIASCTSETGTCEEPASPTEP